MLEEKQTVHFVSLGCPKNLVDSEVMLGHLVRAGLKPVDCADDAQIIVVNTCGFIDAAKEESVDAIAEMAEIKKSGTCKTLVVAGCLSQRYAPELAAELPEVDHFLGTGNFESIADVLGLPVPAAKSGLRVLQQDDAPRTDHVRLRGRNRLVPFRHSQRAGAARPLSIPDPDFTLTADSPRLATQPSYTAYLKISEGCSNTCAFCIIPKLRGPQRSRTVADCVREAERLILLGATEINLIAQNLCAYGNDLKPRESLAELLRRLNALGEQMQRPLWIRSLYAYPKGLTDEVIDVLADAPHVLPYLDMPLQHIHDGMLRRMRRGAGANATRALLKKLRARVPNLVLRTTFITGMPGEGPEEFAELRDFVEEMRFERLGVFTYSREDDTPAGAMEEQVKAEVAEARRNELMELQATISREQQAALVGSTLSVLVEGVSTDTDLLLQGRHFGQAPEIDGVTYINDGSAAPGDVVSVLIDQADNYDLVGGIVSET